MSITPFEPKNHPKECEYLELWKKLLKSEGCFEKVNFVSHFCEKMWQCKCTGMNELNAKQCAKCPNKTFRNSHCQVTFLLPHQRLTGTFLCTPLFIYTFSPQKNLEGIRTLEMGMRSKEDEGEKGLYISRMEMTMDN